LHHRRLSRPSCIQRNIFACFPRTILTFLAEVFEKRTFRCRFFLLRAAPRVKTLSKKPPDEARKTKKVELSRGPRSRREEGSDFFVCFFTRNNLERESAEPQAIISGLGRTRRNKLLKLLGVPGASRGTPKEKTKKFLRQKFNLT